ncbi:hypothetical protein JVT61DRAFT_6744 [Boletus reticuloceps]|uniref:Uncharacterized protein n=1 Tax=Boletus reticuloceps TaxID=495285 RepID=A0A8I2YJH7_9AGAM|nr:hypothetical protein JVT61DRAFT_6744 [Boletus reticuloceps]
MADEDACSSVDPANVLRGCHIIPLFADGCLHPDGVAMSRCAGDSGDWKYYYINCQTPVTGETPEFYDANQSPHCPCLDLQELDKVASESSSSVGSDSEYKSKSVLGDYLDMWDDHLGINLNKYEF